MSCISKVEVEVAALSGSMKPCLSRNVRMSRKSGADEAFGAADFVFGLVHDRPARPRRDVIGELFAGLEHGLRQFRGIVRAESPHHEGDNSRGPAST